MANLGVSPLTDQNLPIDKASSSGKRQGSRVAGRPREPNSGLGRCAQLGERNGSPDARCATDGEELGLVPGSNASGCRTGVTGCLQGATIHGPDTLGGVPNQWGEHGNRPDD